MEDEADSKGCLDELVAVAYMFLNSAFLTLFSLLGLKGRYSLKAYLEAPYCVRGGVISPANLGLLPLFYYY